MEAALRAVAPEAAPFGVDVHAHLEIESTNDLAARLAADGAPEGTLVVAGAQTRGRGRRGTTFHSPPLTGVYLSTILRPDGWPASEGTGAGMLPFVTLMAGVAVVDAVHGLGATHAELKWPNDVVVPVEGRRGEWRKLAGILAEAFTNARGDRCVILGVGLNVSAAPRHSGLHEIATSLADAVTGDVPDVQVVACALVVSLARQHQLLAQQGRVAIVDAWRRYAPSTRGRRVRWTDAGRQRTGHARSIDDTGALCVDTPDGLARIVAGEVTWEPVHG